MAVYITIFLVALILAIGTTPVVRHIALTTGIVDVPNERKLHQNAIPLLGGVAIYFAAITALIVFGDLFYIPQLIAIVVGATLMSFLGIWDDRGGVSPVLKLTGQLVAAGILLATGVSVEFLRNEIIDAIVTVVWIVTITNSLNLMDNMDGLAGGVATIASAFFFLLAVFSGQYLVASLSVALLGSCLGFLYYNFNPAKIFMGDTGSLFLGYVLAAVGIKLRFDNLDIVTWMVPVMVLGLPLFDTTLVIISRLRRRRNPLTTPGKDHTSHRLVALGLTQREAVMTLYLVCGALGICALFLTKASVFEGYTVGALIALVALYSLVRLEQVWYTRVQRDRSNE